MGERKVLNKYYPPDFDPAKIPRRRQPKNLQIKVRMMLPMSIQCSTCGNYIYKGTKFNSRKEDCVGETYLGIQILRFYFKCTKCSAELTMKTDPQNSDYTMESGATRNYEPWRASDEAVEGAKSKREAEELGDAMKALENRTLDSKQEMDIMAALDEMKSMRARHAGVGTTEMLEALYETRQEKAKALEEEDEAVLRSVVFQNSDKYVRRLDDEEFDEEEDDGGLEHVQDGRKRRKSVSLVEDSAEEGQPPNRKVSSGPQILIRPKPITFAIKPKLPDGTTVKMETTHVVKQKEETVDLKENEEGEPPASMGLSALGLAYDSDSD